MIGLYSERMAADAGTIFYLDSAGNAVEVTAVHRTDEGDWRESYAWPDMAVVSADLVRYSHIGRPPTCVFRPIPSSSSHASLRTMS